MNNWRRWLQRKIGRRNLPFIGAVVVLAVIIVVLMTYSPRTDSGTMARSPTVLAD